MRSIFLTVAMSFAICVAVLAYEPPQVTDTGSRITERNSSFWRFSWKLTFYNPNSEAIVFDAEIHWIDADGFVIKSDRQYRLSVGARRSETVRGST